ncbi:MAG TPA: hypothetical protein VF787_24115 [Thermoanaerobaculia bacterium]
MKAYDLRLEIPARSFINHQILQTPTLQPALDAAAGELFATALYRDQGLIAGEYPLFNQAHVVSLLYCLIVVPKEILGLNADDELFRTMDAQSAFAQFRIHASPSPKPETVSYSLIHAWRNSVSHALFEIDPRMNFRFWTERNPKWDFSVARDNLMKFLSQYGALLANAALRARALSSESLEE